MGIFRKALVLFRRWRYPGSSRYWERRYARGGHSGAGSSGELAAYKASVINRFVQERDIKSIVELGCGDGQQLQLAEYPSYLGLDIAATAVAICQKKFVQDPSKSFALYVPQHFQPHACQADLALSLEVMFHLTEDEVYHAYMQHLFALSRRWVIVFAANTTDTTGGLYPHFKPRLFLPDVPAGWVLTAQLPNPHADKSLSEFFVFERE